MVGILSIPYLCACVATIFATVWAKEDSGLTWKTGYESFPSLNPLSVKITVRKWKHDALSKGIELDLVRYWSTAFSQYINLAIRNIGGVP